MREVELMRRGRVGGQVRDDHGGEALALGTQRDSEPAMIGAYQNRLPLGNRIGRKLWWLVWAVLCRPTPERLFFWRRWLLKVFGAEMAEGSNVYPRCRVWAPWNLKMGRHSCLANDVDCYAVDRVELGDFVVVSQGAHLCGASHDITDPEFRLLTGPIRLEKSAWVAAGAFVGVAGSLRVGVVGGGGGGGVGGVGGDGGRGRGGGGEGGCGQEC